MAETGPRRSSLLQKSEFDSPETRAQLAAAGLDSLDGLHDVRGEAFNQRADRVVWTCLLPETASGTERRIYIKLNRGRRRLWPRMTDLKTGQVGQTLTTREWNGIGVLAGLGLAVPRRLALLEEGLLHFRSAVVMDAVPPADSVDMLLQNGGWWQLSPADRNQILEGMIGTVVRISAAGFGWRGTGSRHFYPERQPDGQWKHWLIDCEGVHRSTSPAVLRRDLDKLARSMVESGADQPALDRLTTLIDSALAGAVLPGSRRAATLLRRAA
ncbi:MAG: hypothetical protein KDA79_06585 [Planctomycetaceae bacterium]|nr:hypothetical protein [Planctomycetaceae bacterium]